jgi:glycogen operon protein
MIDFTTRELALRRQTHPLGNHWYSGLPSANGLADVSWLQSSGAEMQPHNWTDTSDGVLGCLIGQPGRSKAPLLLLFNPQAIDRLFALPAGSWHSLLDSSCSEPEPQRHGTTTYMVSAHSLVLLVAG